MRWVLGRAGASCSATCEALEPPRPLGDVMHANGIWYDVVAYHGDGYEDVSVWNSSAPTNAEHQSGPALAQQPLHSSGLRPGDRLEVSGTGA